MYQSPSGVPTKHTSPFTDLTPISHTTGISTLRDFAIVGLIDMNGPFCQHGTSSLRFPASTVNYSLSALGASMNILI